MKLELACSFYPLSSHAIPDKSLKKWVSIMRFLPLSVICLKIKPNTYSSMKDFPTPSSPKFSAQIGLVSILLLHKQGDIKHTQVVVGEMTDRTELSVDCSHCN